MEFENYKSSVINYLKQKYPNIDYKNSSQVSQFVDQLTYLQVYLEENIESQFSETFYDSQRDVDNLKSILSLYQYDRRYVLPQFGTVNLILDLSQFDNIKYIKYHINEFVLSSTKNPDIKYRIVNYNVNNQDYIENISNNKLTIPVFVFQSNIQTQTYTITSNDIDMFELQIPDEQNVILESVKGTLTDNYNNVYDCYFQKDFIELFELINIKKVNGEVYLLHYSEKNQKYYIIQQNFFNRKRIEGTLTVEYSYSFGEYGNVQSNELTIDIVNIDIEIFTDSGFINRKITSFDDILIQIQHEEFNNGKNKESIDEWIQNQKLNRTFGRQITLNDFNLWFDLYIHNYFLSIYDYSYSITYDYSYFSNSVIIYLYFYSQISENKKLELFNIIKSFFEQITPFGMYVLVKEQKTVKLSLGGTISFSTKNTTQQKIISELQKLLYEYNSSFKSKKLQTLEISKMELQKSILSSIDGILDVDLQIFQNDKPQQDSFKIKSNSVVFFDEIQNFINNITFIQIDK